MKGSQKITRIHLSVDDQDKPAVFGLVTTDPDYKISLKLNRKFALSLRNGDPAAADDTENAGMQFSRFIDYSGAPDILFCLVSNRTGKNFLFKQLRNIDFLFLVHDPYGGMPSSDLARKLREIESVTAVFELDPGTLKEKNINLLLH
jgi:hypothetical protein